MFMHKSKKGFTIVELVIVIAVIAILAAVLIPTFSNLVKKANQSADIQAARQMNTVLAAEGAVEKNNIFEVYEALAANGMTAKDYRPLTTDHYFFWDDVADRIVYTDKNYQVIFPTDFQKDAKANWISLTAKIPTTKPASYDKDESSVTVKSAEELAYVVEQLKSGQHTASSLTIDIGSSTIDAMGANVMISTAAGGAVTKDITLKGTGTIKNATNIDSAHAGNKGEGDDGLYTSGGLFGIVGNGATVTIEGITVENVNVKNTNVSNAAVLVASATGQSGNILGGKVVIKNVTINNCTVIAHRNAGALVGNDSDSGASVKLEGTITMNNVNVKTVGGRSGLLIGYVKDSNLIKDASLKIELTNCSYSIYECEQNTGTFEGQKLGYDKATNILWSYAYNNSERKNELENKRFFEGAYATEKDTNGAQAKYAGLDSYIK